MSSIRVDIEEPKRWPSRVVALHLSKVCCFQYSKCTKGWLQRYLVVVDLNGLQLKKIRSLVPSAC